MRAGRYARETLMILQAPGVYMSSIAYKYFVWVPHAHLILGLRCEWIFNNSCEFFREITHVRMAWAFIA